MAITITLDDDLLAKLTRSANRQRLTVEQIAISILTTAVQDTESITPHQAVASIPGTMANLSQVRLAQGSLADALRVAPPSDPSFDLESWNRQWSDVEAELKAITRANDVAEGYGA